MHPQIHSLADLNAFLGSILLCITLVCVLLFAVGSIFAFLAGVLVTWMQKRAKNKALLTAAKAEIAQK